MAKTLSTVIGFIGPRANDIVEKARSLEVYKSGERYSDNMPFLTARGTKRAEKVFAVDPKLNLPVVLYATNLDVWEMWSLCDGLIATRKRSKRRWGFSAVSNTNTIIYTFVWGKTLVSWRDKYKEFIFSRARNSAINRFLPHTRTYKHMIHNACDYLAWYSSSVLCLRREYIGSTVSGADVEQLDEKARAN